VKKKEKEEKKRERPPFLVYARRNIEGYKTFISIDIPCNITSNLLQLLFLQLVNHPTGKKRSEQNKE
jgi:hypothetical protein